MRLVTNDDEERTQKTNDIRYGLKFYNISHKVWYILKIKHYVLSILSEGKSGSPVKSIDWIDTGCSAITVLIKASLSLTEKLL